MDEALLSIGLVGCGQLVKMLRTLEPHSISGSNLAWLFILTLSSHKAIMSHIEKLSDIMDFGKYEVHYTLHSNCFFKQNQGQ